MDVTILFNNRQKKILSLFINKGELSRSELTQLILPEKAVSKITLIRDLNSLIKAKLLASKGQGRARRYFLPNNNPLLRYFDIQEYFQKDPDTRGGKKGFENEIFGKIGDLFTDEEKALWFKASEEFKRRINRLDKSIYKRELERFIIDFSWKSAQIEGNTYDLLETETLFTQNIEAKGHSKEEAIMLINHKQAFDAILENKKNFRKLVFSDVIQLHRVLTKRLTNPGIRKQAVRITGISYVPPSSGTVLENYLRQTIKLINTTVSGPQKALLASVLIAYLQPFSDGNKRTARMLSNALLLAHDSFPLSYRNVEVTEYKKALIVFYEQNNLYYFKKIFTEQLEFALKNYFVSA